MNNNPATGAGYLLQGLRLLGQPGLRRFVFIPLTVNVIVFSLLIWLGLTQFEALLDSLVPDSGWLSYVRWLLWPLFAIAVVLVVFFTFTAVANLIAAPFNGLLAEKVEKYLTSGAPTEDTDWKALIADIGPSIASELRKLSYFLVRALPLLILFLIPGVNLAAPLLWLLFNAWYMSLEYGDFPMGNHGLKFREQLPQMRNIRFAALGFGSVLTLLMMVPVLNFLAMPAAVAGATALWVGELKPVPPPRDEKPGRPVA
jgi:CysZ protein